VRLIKFLHEDFYKTKIRKRNWCFSCFFRLYSCSNVCHVTWM